MSLSLFSLFFLALHVWSIVRRPHELVNEQNSASTTTAVCSCAYHPRHALSLRTYAITIPPNARVKKKKNLARSPSLSLRIPTLLPPPQSKSCAHSLMYTVGDGEGKREKESSAGFCRQQKSERLPRLLLSKFYCVPEVALSPPARRQVDDARTGLRCNVHRVPNTADLFIFVPIIQHSSAHVNKRGWRKPPNARWISPPQRKANSPLENPSQDPGPPKRNRFETERKNSYISRGDRGALNMYVV